MVMGWDEYRPRNPPAESTYRSAAAAPANAASCHGTAAPELTSHFRAAERYQTAVVDRHGQQQVAPQQSQGVP